MYRLVIGHKGVGTVAHPEGLRCLASLPIHFCNDMGLLHFFLICHRFFGSEFRICRESGFLCACPKDI